jgi:hypothetical protein
MGATASQLSTERDVARPSFSLTVLSNPDARAALLEAERGDQYRVACYADRLNAIARTGQSYVAAKQSDTDRAHAQTHLTQLQHSIPSTLQTLGNVEVAYLMPSADGGLPHTRPTRLICLPMRPTPVSIETILHELWHVHQRVNKARWHHFLSSRWHFVPYKHSLPDKFQGMVRLNPDTLETPLWLWKNEWVPVCVFTNPTTPTLQDTAVWFYNTQKGQYSTTVPAAMAAFFGTTLQAVAYEHPYEMGAYFLASDRPSMCEAYAQLKAEFS